MVQFFKDVPHNWGPVCFSKGRRSRNAGANCPNLNMNKQVFFDDAEYPAIEIDIAVDVHVEVHCLNTVEALFTKA